MPRRRRSVAFALGGLLGVLVLALVLAPIGDTLTSSLLTPGAPTPHALPGSAPTQAVLASGDTSTAPGQAVHTAPLVAGAVTLSVHELAPEVLSSGQDLQISGSVTNGTEAPISSAALVVQVQDRTEIAGSQLSSWLAGERDTSMVTVLIEDLGAEVGPGASQDFSVTVSASSLPLSDAGQWGPRGIRVALTEGHSTLATDRTLLVWGDVSGIAPSRVTTVVPVTASPAELAAVTMAMDSSEAEEEATPSASPTASPTAGAQDSGEAAESTRVAAVRTRVEGLLDLAGQGVVLAVDPALLEALGVEVPQQQTSGSATPTPTPAPTASAAATAAAGKPEDLASRLQRAAEAGDVVALPWADADVAALAHLQEQGLIDSAVTRAAQSGTAAAGAWTTTAWPAGSALDAATMDALPASVNTVIAAPGDLAPEDDLTYTPSGLSLVGERAVLIPDAGLSATMSGVLTTSEGTTELSELDLRQLLRAHTAIITRQAPALGRDVIVVVDRQEAASVDPQVLALRLGALKGMAWTTPQTLSGAVENAWALGAEEGPARTALPAAVVQEGELGATELGSARQVEAHLGSVASVLSDPEALLGETTDLVAITASASWRPDPLARSMQLEAASQAAQTVANGLSAAPSSTINLIAASAALPIRIVSSLDQDVTVVVSLASDSQRLQPDGAVVVTVPAHSSATASVPVRAVGSGNIDLTVHLLATDGTEVGAPATVHMRVRADWESVGTRIGGAVLALMLVVGVIRTVKRGRRPVTPQEVA
ncbi:DUF6049 family protein [Actinomyces oricola]